jgi:hypothetical protein
MLLSRMSRMSHMSVLAIERLAGCLAHAALSLMGAMDARNRTLASCARGARQKMCNAERLGAHAFLTIKTRLLACVWMLPHSRPAHAFLTPHHAGVPSGVDTQEDAALLPPPNQPPPEGDKERAKQKLGGLDAVVCVDIFGQYLSGIGGESLLTSAAHLPHLRHLSLSSCVFPACSVAPIAQVSSLVSSCLLLPRGPRCKTQR